MKLKQIILTALALTLPLAGALAQTRSTNTLPSGLVAWWAAEGNATDRTANHHDGSGFGGVSYVTSRYGTGFAFDGVDGVVQVPDSPALQLPTALSIEFWARRQRNAIDIVLEKGGDWNSAQGGEANYGVGLHSFNNRMFYFFFRGGWRGTSGVADFNWHHYAVTATNGAANPVLYIDGDPRPVEYSDGAAALNLYPSSRPLHLGAQLSPGWNYYGNNVLDDVRLYNRALTAGEVVYLCEGPLPAGLASCWSGEGDATDTIGSNHGNAGTGVSYAAGKRGSAFRFVDSPDSTIQFPNSATFQPTNNQFTIAAWVKPDFTSANMIDTILEKRDGCSSSYSFIFSVLKSYPGYSHGCFGLGMQPQIDFINSNNNIPDDGHFHHVAVTYNGNKASNNCTLYLDGRSVGGGNGPGNIPPSTAGPIVGLHRCLNLNSSMALDELAFYGLELTPAEIVSVYLRQGGSPVLDIQPQSPGVALSWPVEVLNPQVEASTNLGSGNWQADTNAVTSTDTRSSVLLPASDARRFFRLKTGN